jgi:uncharacterized protein (TIGR03067 family)
METMMRGMLVIALLVMLAPDRPDPSPKPETPALGKQLFGEWQLVKNVVAGAEAAPDGLTMVFTAEALQQVDNRNGLRTALGSYKFVLDATRNPARISFPQTKYEGIIKIEGDILTICFANAGSSEPPAQFASTAGSGAIILEARRLKK